MKKISNILKYICIVSLLFCFFPVSVFADSVYFPVVSGVSYTRHFYEPTGGNTVTTRDDANMIFDGNDIRIVAFIRNASSTSQTVSWIAMSLNSFKYGSTSANTNASSKFIDGTRVYYANFYYAWKYLKVSFNSVTPTIYDFTDLSSGTEEFERAYDIAFNGNVPSEPINWGLVRDPEYSTRIAGNGYAAKRNIDYLSWNNEVDSNGNDISECSINIKAVLGSWSGTTEEDLLNKTYNDFNIGNYSAVDLGSVPASSGLFSVSWQRIIDEAGWNFDSIYSHLEDNLFLKQGWYYQLQLVDPDGGVHQWQTLYTPLSTSAAASETVINHNSFDTSIYQVYQDIATINNNTSITINIQDTDYTVTNPDDGDEPDGGVDLWDILKQMLNGIFQIVKNIAALPGKFFEMIQQLITPPQQISEEINTNFNNNMQDLNESQPGLMESMNAVEDIQDTLNQSVNSFNGVPECIFTWDAVTMDLSAFNAGTVTFIAAGSFDFAASFMQMINGFGMTYSEYQFYVSAIIYAWILVFIYRHVYDFLAGTKES